MKSFFRNILSVSMAIVVLLSTVSFSVDMHYCGDTLVDVALNTKATTCGMETMQNLPLKSSITKEGCCTDHKVVVDGQDELNTSPSQLSVDNQLFLVSFVYVYNALFETLPKQVTPFQDYRPPTLVSDFQVDYETFLI
ncbi:HYC_CC_PP family protein [Formosa sp. 3Alg 14/1]|uniref:HYC_CC_PP family protein n=1 Tax=Formosa sp. 3Alg 14/1 TaxID=3382190 RepID=UPI0039BE1E24